MSFEIELYLIFVAVDGDDVLHKLDSAAIFKWKNSIVCITWKSLTIGTYTSVNQHEMYLGEIYFL